MWRWPRHSYICPGGGTMQPSIYMNVCMLFVYTCKCHVYITSDHYKKEINTMTESLSPQIAIVGADCLPRFLGLFYIQTVFPLKKRLFLFFSFIIILLGVEGCEDVYHYCRLCLCYCSELPHRDEAPRILELLPSTPGPVTDQLWGLEERLTLSVAIPSFHRDMNSTCSMS